MNDFTKDELKDLWNRIHGKPSLLDTGELAYLSMKMKEMIDDYCEHKDKKNINNCIDCGVSEYRCNNCATVNYEGLE